MTIAGVVIAAIGYASFSINGIVILWNLAPTESVAGAYTGLYAIASALGASFGPALIGGMVDLTDWRFLFLHAALLAAAALVLFLFVRTESNPAQLRALEAEV